MTTDESLGKFVYCAQHVGPHVTGWCTVGNDQKLSLPADTNEEAWEWMRYLKLPWHGHCGVCQEPLTMSAPQVCVKKHSAEQVKAAERRRQQLRQYLHYRFARTLTKATIHGVDTE